jgi:AcrR family transcriptional regulator
MAPRTRTREDPQVRRRQIVDEAIRLIGRRGYHGFTIQELARTCGLTNGGLLHYFGSKEQLLVAILQERDRRAAAVVPTEVDFRTDAGGEGDYAAETVLQVFRAIVAQAVAEPELIRFFVVLQSEALDPAHPAHDHFLRREAMVLHEFASLLAGHVADPGATARCVYALISGLERQWLWADRGFDLLAAWDHAAGLLPPFASVRADAISTT